MVAKLNFYLVKNRKIVSCGQGSASEWQAINRAINPAINPAINGPTNGPIDSVVHRRSSADG
jgi:hypothetical protein